MKNEGFMQSTRQWNSLTAWRIFLYPWHLDAQTSWTKFNACTYQGGKTQRMYYMSTNSERDWQIAKINSYCNYLSKRKSRQHLLNAAGLDSDWNFYYIIKCACIQNGFEKVSAQHISQYLTNWLYIGIWLREHHGLSENFSVPFVEYMFLRKVYE